MHLRDLLDKAAQKRHNLSPEELAALLALEGEAELSALYKAAYEVKKKYSGKNVSLRGLVEMSNICAKNCFYCGIRRGNSEVDRFRLEAEAVVRMAEWAYRENYGSVVIQAGEVESDAYTEMIADILKRIAAFSNREMGVTLSLGEQKTEVYGYWREAGAHRYLLRIETSSPDLYRRLHPSDHRFERRKQCLLALRELGYQVGSGVMSGLPGQTVENLAADILFFRDMDIDMIGMGPFIPHKAAPLGKDIEISLEYLAGQLRYGLKMIAVARLYLHDVNIASTTALQTLAPDGREQGLLAGGNVIMPNITDLPYRKNYQLYSGKTGIEENAAQSRVALSNLVSGIGENILWGQRGDSPHYHQRCGPRPD